jgi:hypothetical protein
MAKKDNDNEATPETPPVAKPAVQAKDPFLVRLLIKKAGKVVEAIESIRGQNYTVCAATGTEITKAERPAIVKELRSRFPGNQFTWVG